MINFSKIKLIIWDLDDTFWKGTLSEGTLSEGDIIPIKEHIELIKKLSTRGIINSICSKNDFSQTICKLQELAVAEYFVFPSVNWDAKGNRISRLIKDMGLRPINCLFIDDNVVNLNEAKFYSQELQIAEPDIISELIDFVERTKETDHNLERLMQYRVLETKHQAKSEASDNMSFLYASNAESTASLRVCTGRTSLITSKPFSIHLTAKGACSVAKFARTTASISCSRNLSKSS